jgi:hypothetical protein
VVNAGGFIKVVLRWVGLGFSRVISVADKIQFAGNGRGRASTSGHGSNTAPSLNRPGGFRDLPLKSS